MKGENTIAGIYGHKGAGKTLSCTYLAWHIYSFCGFNKIFSNYKLNIPFSWLNGNDLINISDKFNDSIVIIDELHEYADSRNSSTFQNKRVCDFFLQSRHTRSNILYTTQYKDQVDVRIRRITDIDIVCENPRVDSDKDGNDDVFRMIIYDRRYPDNKPYERLYYAKPLFNMFDSTERINPFMLPKKSEKEWIDKYAKDNEFIG